MFCSLVGTRKQPLAGIMCAVMWHEQTGSIDLIHH